MPKSIRDIPNKRGRPRTTGQGTAILVRGHDDFLNRLDDWASRQDDQPSRPEAIRRLVEQALAADQPTKRTPAKTAARAAALAGKAIDRNSDPTATPDERNARKHRILKRPGMAREEG